MVVDPIASAACEIPCNTDGGWSSIVSSGKAVESTPVFFVCCVLQPIPSAGQSDHGELRAGIVRRAV